MIMKSQAGVTLIEMLTVVAIIAILSFVTGTTLIKWLPDQNLRSASLTLVQDLRQAQSYAIKQMRPWKINFDTAGQVYSLIDSGPDGIFGSADDILFKTINLQNYSNEIRFVAAATSSQMIFNEEGLGSAGATVRMTNSVHSLYNISISRAGAIRIN